MITRWALRKLIGQNNNDPLHSCRLTDISMECSLTMSACKDPIRFRTFTTPLYFSSRCWLWANDHQQEGDNPAPPQRREAKKFYSETSKTYRINKRQQWKGVLVTASK